MKIFTRIALVLFLASLVSSISAQNLVPNPGFDTVVNCQTGILLPGSTISDAEGWVSPSQASADHFNACHTTFSLNLMEPTNFMGTQEPLSGDSYAGVITFEDTTITSNYREYIQIQLTEPLAQNVEYSIGFSCSLADDAMYAADGLGMHVSVDQVVEPSQYIMNVTPQLVSGVVNDDENWVQIFGTYTAAGGESYVTLGCFTDDESVILEDTGAGFFVRAYYYVDNVYVIDSNETVGIDRPYDQAIRIYPNPAQNTLNLDLGSLNDASISVRSLTGERWLDKGLAGGIHSLDVSNLPTGIYIAEISSGTFRQVLRLVIE